jgi:hypothetical protein
MPEIFDEDAEDLLRSAQQTINAAINELNNFRQHRGRTPGDSGTAWMADVRSKATSAGIDLADWQGNPRSEA